MFSFCPKIAAILLFKVFFGGSKKEVANIKNKYNPTSGEFQGCPLGDLVKCQKESMR